MLHDRFSRFSITVSIGRRQMRLDIVQRTEEERMGNVVYVGCDVVVEWVGFLIMLQHSSRPYLTQDFGNQRAIEEGLWIFNLRLSCIRVVDEH